MGSLRGVVATVRAFRGQRALVIGDAMLDIYLQGTATRISPDAPVPVVQGQQTRHAPGGAANAAVNLHTLGAEVSFLSAIGGDEPGTMLRRTLTEQGVSDQFLVRDDERRTLTKLRVMADGQVLVRYDEGDVGEPSRQSESQLITHLRALFPTTDVVVVSDYLSGVISRRVIAELAELTRRHGKLVVVDSKNLKRYRLCNVSVITPNHLEAQRLVDLPAADASLQREDEKLEMIGRQLLSTIQTRWAIITLGAQGALLFERDKPTYRVRPRLVAAPHVIGAGDTFTSALALALSVGGEIQLAAEVAAEAASIAVSRAGTAQVSRRELLQRMSLLQEPVHSIGELQPVIEAYHEAGKSIVFTNGCFDILHGGHVSYLSAAKRLGDILVVGVNDDASVRRLKGPGRPINPAEDRLRVVAALGPVDHAVLFGEDTPDELIRRIRPCYHVKGGDYEATALPEAGAVEEVGGQIVILPLVEGKSSSRIIDRIGKMALSNSRGDVVAP